jgi:hypothetical protein
VRDERTADADCWASTTAQNCAAYLVWAVCWADVHGRCLFSKHWGQHKRCQQETCCHGSKVSNTAHGVLLLLRSVSWAWLSSWVRQLPQGNAFNR